MEVDFLNFLGSDVKFCGNWAVFDLSLGRGRRTGNPALLREIKESSADVAVPHAARRMDGKAPRQS